MQSIIVISFSILMALVFFAGTGNAHPGGLDAKGGHHNRKTGEYHYHQGPNAGQSTTTKEAGEKEKKSTKSKSLKTKKK